MRTDKGGGVVEKVMNSQKCSSFFREQEPEFINYSRRITNMTLTDLFNRAKKWAARGSP
jgi:hypothetical protein